MEELDIKSLSKYIFSKIYITMFSIAIFVSLGLFYTLAIKTPMFKSSTQVVLINSNATNAEGTDITVNDVTLSNNLVTTYSEIVTSRNVLNQTISNLQLPYSYEDLKKNVTVNTTKNTQLITVNVSDENNQTAHDIADEIGKIFKQEILNIYNIDNVQIVDGASFEDEPYNINIAKQAIIFTLIGIMFGLSLSTLIYYLDTSIKDSKTIEDKLGLTVIGIIPEMGKK